MILRGVFEGLEADVLYDERRGHQGMVLHHEVPCNRRCDSSLPPHSPPGADVSRAAASRG